MHEHRGHGDGRAGGDGPFVEVEGPVRSNALESVGGH